MHQVGNQPRLYYDARSANQKNVVGLSHILAFQPGYRFSRSAVGMLCHLSTIQRHRFQFVRFSDNMLEAQICEVGKTLPELNLGPRNYVWC